MDSDDDPRFGLSIDISESGALFEASDQLPVGTWITMTFETSGDLAFLAPDPVTNVAEVVRHGPPTRAVPYPVAVRFGSARSTGHLRASAADAPAHA